MAKARLFITGTDTGVGKTFVTVGLLSALLRARMKVAVVKPFATGCRRLGDHLVSEDAELFATEFEEPFDRAALEALSFYRYESPVAPYAAQLAGEEPARVNWASVRQELDSRAQNVDVLLVEGIGGVATPLSHEHFAADLAAAAGASTLLVAANRLGVISQVVTSVAFLKQRSAPCTGFVFNEPAPLGMDASQVRNAPIIEELTGLPYLGFVPHGQAIRRLFDELARRMGLVEE